MSCIEGAPPPGAPCAASACARPPCRAPRAAGARPRSTGSLSCTEWSAPTEPKRWTQRARSSPPSAEET
eukprot:1995110-Alexandrium_andersonii.AAC.1